MKITQLTSNYKTYANKSETSKQASSTNPVISEKEIFNHLKGQNIAFAGFWYFGEGRNKKSVAEEKSVEEVENPQEIVKTPSDINSEEIAGILYNVEQGYFYDNTYDKFKELIQSPDFDYNCKNNYMNQTVMEQLNSRCSNHKRDNYNLRLLKNALYFDRLNKNDEMTFEMREYFSQDERVKEFLSDIAYKEDDISLIKKALNTIKTNTATDVNKLIKESPEALIEACRYDNKEYAEYLFNNGAKPFLNDDGWHAYEFDTFKEILPKNKMVLYCIENSILPEEFSDAIKDIDVNLDDMDGNGSSIETVIKEKIKDENFSEQLLNLIKQTRQEKKNYILSEDDEKFLNYARKGMTQAIKILFDSGKPININAIDEESDSNAMDMAINTDNAGLFRMLVSHPDFNINAIDKNGDSVGIRASQQGDLKILNEIAQNPPKNFNPNYVNVLDDTYRNMIRCAKNGETLQSILKIPGIKLYEENSNFDHPFLDFANREFFDNFQVIAKLPGIDLEMKNKKGQTIFDIIDKQSTWRKSNYLEVVQKMQDKKTIRDMKAYIDKVGMLNLKEIRTYLEYPKISNIIDASIGESNESIGHYLFEQKVNADNLDEIIELYDQYIDAEPNINRKDKYGMTALMKAVNVQNLFAIEFLLQNSADKHIKNNANISAYKMAKESGNPEIIKLFDEN